jgi:hypothetical protein
MQLLSERAQGSRVPYAQLTRAQFFGGLFVLGCANGLAIRMARSVSDHGWLEATFGTYDVSLIVLAACFAGVSLVLRGGDDTIRYADLAVAAVFVALVALPVTSMSWLAVGALALYILLFTTVGEEGRRGVKILLAATVPMLLMPWLFGIFSRFVLAADGLLVGWMLGTDRNGNFVDFADHSATVVVYPGCSSLPNMALAFLCWVTVSQFVGHRWRPVDAFWCLLAIASVWAVNIVRMSIMGLSLSYYHTLHGTAGDIPTNAVQIVLMVAISLLGVRRELSSRA